MLKHKKISHIKSEFAQFLCYLCVKRVKATTNKNKTLWNLKN